MKKMEIKFKLPAQYTPAIRFSRSGFQDFSGRRMNPEEIDSFAKRTAGGLYNYIDSTQELCSERNNMPYSPAGRG